jgi:O-antigen ligase
MQLYLKVIYRKMNRISLIRTQHSPVDSVFSKSNSFRNRLVSLISVFAIFAQQIFFTMSGLIGYNYAGKGDSPIYVQFIVLVFIAMVLMYAQSFIKKPRISKSEMGFYIFFIFLIANHLLWVSLDGGATLLLSDNLIFFFSLGVTGFMAARAIHAFEALHELIRLTDIVIFLMAVGLVVAIVLPYNTGLISRGIGGGSYQAASYYAAMCFGMLGVATFRLEKDLRYKWFRGRISLVVNVLLMTALFIAAIINGGRGAFILIILYSGLVFFWIANKHGLTRRSVIRYIAVAMSLAIILPLAMHKILSDPLLAPGFDRATAFIGSPDGGLIDMERGSSGRDIVYDIALKGIDDSPWIGYGAFGHWEKVIMPHNIFLDLSLQFGVLIALLLTISISVILWRKFKPLTSEKVWLLVLFLAVAVILSFSGGYLRSAIFWFCLASVFFLKPH